MCRMSLVLDDDEVAKDVQNELNCSTPEALIGFKKARLSMLTRDGQEPPGAILLRAHIDRIEEIHPSLAQV